MCVCVRFRNGGDAGDRVERRGEGEKGRRVGWEGFFFVAESPLK